MRRIVRLVIVLSVLAGVAAPASLAAERMWVGFHDDPSFRWVTDRQELVAGSAQNNASIIRLLVQWNLAAKTRPANADGPVRSGVRVRRHRRGRQVGAGERPGSDPHDLRHAALGERRQEPERHADAGRRLHQLRARDRVALLGPVRWDIRSCASGRSGTSRTSSSSSARSSTRAAAPSRRRTTRSSPQPRTPGLKAGNPLAQVAIGETSARGSDKANGLRPTHSPGKFAELVAKANPRLKFDAWSHHPYPFGSEPRRRRRS